MRNYKIDNIRFILIFLVVLGHFFEPTSSTTLAYISEFIYSFHMPVFVFISGYLAKFNTQRIVRTYLYSYILMQTVYILFNKYYLGIYTTSFDYSYPHYTLWYLLAMAMYCMIIPLIQTDRIGKKIVVLAISLFISLFAGTDLGVGYAFTAARFFGFLPFFVLGYYMRTEPLTEKLKKITLPVKLLLGIVFGGAICFFEMLILNTPLVSIWDTYYAFPYIQTNGGWKARVILLITGFLWIAFFFIITPKKKIPVISNIGANTFPIYIFHGLVVKIMLNGGLSNLDSIKYTVITVAVSAAMLLIFGTKTASAVAKWGFTGHWIGVLEKKLKRES